MSEEGLYPDAYFSADVETDGPIPGAYSMLSFALVYVGRSNGKTLIRSPGPAQHFYGEMKPISDEFQAEALAVNGLNRERLSLEGGSPAAVMENAAAWVRRNAFGAKPVLVAYPLSFDWSWLYWYFIKFCEGGSPFDYSRCYDIKTAYAVKAGLPINAAGRSHLPRHLRSLHRHSHHALDDAIEQAEVFANVFEWNGSHGRD